MDDVLDLSNNNMYELKLRMVYEQSSDKDYPRQIIECGNDEILKRHLLENKNYQLSFEFNFPDTIFKDFFNQKVGCKFN